jgi:ribose transport system ATP-binding protein
MSAKARVPALDIAHLSKAYGPTHALDDVSVEVQRGELHALIGANGSGKTTLVKVVAGVARGSPGGVIRAGDASVAVDRITPPWSRRAGVRVVHQDLAVFADLTVAENVALSAGFARSRLKGIDWRTVRARTAELLERFGIEARPDALAGSLTLADRAMLAIARALAAPGTAHVLVLDEATAALGAADAARVLQLARQLADQGQGVLVVSHRITEVLSSADRATVLRDGLVAATLAGASLDEEHALAAMATPASAQAAALPTPAEGSEPVLVVEDVVGRHVHGVSLWVRPNEVVGLAAAPRAAASELLQMIFGAAPIRSGAVQVAGVAKETNRVQHAMRAGVAYVPGDRATATFGDMTIAENLSAATVPTYWRRGRLRRRPEREDARRSMEQFSVAASTPQQLLRTLSGGNQQKVLLARWLRRGPRLLLLDEPTRGVDVAARRQIAAAVRAAAAAGAGVLLASDDYEELCAVAGRVVVLVDGRNAGELTGALDPVQIARLAATAPARG